MGLLSAAGRACLAIALSGAVAFSVAGPASADDDDRDGKRKHSDKRKNKHDNDRDRASDRDDDRRHAAERKKREDRERAAERKRQEEHARAEIRKEERERAERRARDDRKRATYFHERGYGNLQIPVAQLPPPGQCRVWYPGIAPAQQPLPGRCESMQANVPPGAWLIKRPRDDVRYVNVVAQDEQRSGIADIIGVFLANNGDFVRMLKQ